MKNILQGQGRSLQAAKTRHRAGKVAILTQLLQTIPGKVKKKKYLKKNSLEKAAVEARKDSHGGRKKSETKKINVFPRTWILFLENNISIIHEISNNTYKYYLICSCNVF